LETLKANFHISIHYIESRNQIAHHYGQLGRQVSLQDLAAREQLAIPRKMYSFLPAPFFSEGLPLRVFALIWIKF
jgi:hypothetical protein